VDRTSRHVVSEGIRMSHSARVDTALPAVGMMSKNNTPFTRYNRLSNRLFNRFDNGLYRVNKHPTGCVKPGCTTV